MRFPACATFTSVSYTHLDVYKRQVDNKEPETAAGTFEAKASGYGGELNLTVTIDNNVITDIALGENHETNVVIDRAFPIIRDRILEANSPVVDSVSAATFSSFAVKSAVADAMKQAGMEVEAITMTTAGPAKEAKTLSLIPIYSPDMAFSSP